MRLAVDASSVVAESLRGRGEWLIGHSDLALYVAAPTWSEIQHEVARRIDALVQHRRLMSSQRDEVLRDRLALLTQNVTVVGAVGYGEYAAEARGRIPRDPNDWPTVALALSLGCGIWTHDQDFFGCGVPVWTTETLLTHVAAGRAAPDR